MSRKKQQERFLRTKVQEDMSLNKYLNKLLPLLCLSCHLAILKKKNKKNDTSKPGCLSPQEADVMGWWWLTLGKCPDTVGHRSSPLQFPQRLGPQTEQSERQSFTVRAEQFLRNSVLSGSSFW